MPTSARIIIIGLFGGFFGSLVGLGGAVVMIPLMTGWARITQHKAHITSLVAVVFTGIVGALAYAGGGKLDLALAAVIAAVAIVSSMVAAAYSERVPAGVLRRIFGGLLVLAAIVLLFDFGSSSAGITNWWRYPAGALLGLMSGALTGLLGIGGGAFVVPLLVIVFGLSQHVAQGTSLAVMIPAALAGTFVHWRARRIDHKLAWPLVAGVITGAFIGGRFALGLGERPLQIVFGIILLWTGFRYLKPVKPVEPRTEPTVVAATHKPPDDQADHR